MKISLIAAMSKNRVIGQNNQLPWHLPADLKHFKCLTLGKPILMGRKTFESIGKALPGRQNIIISQQNPSQFPNCICFPSLDTALQYLSQENVAELMVIGGAQIFEQILPMADILYLTILDAELAGDTLFPEWYANEWQEVSREQHSADEANHYSYTFLELRRAL